VSAIGDRHRAQALSWSSAAAQSGSALTPLWAGALIGAGSGNFIFFIGATAALIHVTAYGLLLRRYDWRRRPDKEGLQPHITHPGRLAAPVASEPK